jgi:lysyl-tRNA synthetase class I
MFWAIVLVASGITAPSVVYVGQFQEDATCQVALKDLQRQGFKGTCVQIQRPQITTEIGKK